MREPVAAEKTKKSNPTIADGVWTVAIKLDAKGTNLYEAIPLQIADTKHQDIGYLVQGFIEEKRRKFLPKKRGKRG